jgi:hypothetical protein
VKENPAFYALLQIRGWLSEVLDQNRGETVTFKRRAIEELQIALLEAIYASDPQVSSPVTPPPSEVSGPGAGGKS